MQKDIDKQPFYLNWAVVSVAGAIAFILGIYYLYNLQTTIFFVFQTLLAIFNLESIDYIEHYGLRRKRLPNREYEKVTIQHSWNSPYRFSNYIVLKDQRHSDHH
jgi:alkane 1-monooxygenase